MNDGISVSTGSDGLVALTTPAAGLPDVRLCLKLEPVEAALLGTTLIKHAVTALQVKSEGKEAPK